MQNRWLLWSPLRWLSALGLALHKLQIDLIFNDAEATLRRDQFRDQKNLAQSQ